jgi:hypothetical protein
MRTGAERFYDSIHDVEQVTQVELIAFFLYYLTVELQGEIATAKEIDTCFESCHLNPPANTSARLSEGAKSNRKKYIKTKHGYKLHRTLRDELTKRLGATPIVAQTSPALRTLESQLPTGVTREFLSETLDCFEVGANRATIVMSWCLAVDHLQDYILKSKLTEFNAVLSANTDKRVKTKCIRDKDDFGDIPELKFIEFCRSARIISNDVRKILDQKLGTRNSAAHPSAVKFGKAKVVDFVEDLIENVILKYPI